MGSWIVVSIPPALIGVVLGRFLKIELLGFVTFLCWASYILLSLNKEGLELITTFVFFWSALVGNLAMWVTWCISTGQTCLSDFFKKYILR
ncbi:hypothetical protein ACFL16_03550 [Patescibacteria group bacterium]